LAQPMARLGGQVLGIDAAAATLAAASLAASQDASLASSLSFECVTAEELAARGRTFDVVVSSEVIEHVADVDAFCRAACALVKVCGGERRAFKLDNAPVLPRARTHSRVMRATMCSVCQRGERRAAGRYARDDDHEPHRCFVCARHFGRGVRGAHRASRHTRVGKVCYAR
ncbi:methyltransferase domain-containing protein, partial [archaeon]